jgi:transcription antitermination factor NusG
MFETKFKHKTQSFTQQKLWYVIYCKPNTEKRTAQKLKEQSFEVYCPTQTKVRQWSDRKKKIEQPVLPSMILIKIKDKDRALVFQISTVRRYLFIEKQPAVVREKEVEAMQKYLSGDYDRVEVDKIKVGSRLDLDDLGFKNQQGIVKKLSKNQCWIYLESLGYIIKVSR